MVDELCFAAEARDYVLQVLKQEDKQLSPTRNNAIADQVGDRLDDIFGEGSQGDNSTDKAAEADNFSEDVAKKRKRTCKAAVRRLVREIP